ncbi:MAG: YcxB family protein [Bacteroidales bacterium]|nr:YcxB family protein [Bacteroidales bacterium]
MAGTDRIPEYSLNCRMTEPSFVRFNKSVGRKQILKHSAWIILFIAISMFFIISSSLRDGFDWSYVLETGIILILMALFFIFLPGIGARRSYRKFTKDFDYTVDLFQDGWQSTSDHGNTHMEYSETHKIIETKTDFYLMIAERQGVIIPKESCSEEAAAFLRSVKTKYDK